VVISLKSSAAPTATPPPPPPQEDTDEDDELGSWASADEDESKVLTEEEQIEEDARKEREAEAYRVEQRLALRMRAAAMEEDAKKWAKERVEEGRRQEIALQEAIVLAKLAAKGPT